MKELAVELQGQATLTKVNVDDDGELADKMVGLQSKVELKDKIVALAVGQAQPNDKIRD